VFVFEPDNNNRKKLNDFFDDNPNLSIDSRAVADRVEYDGGTNWPDPAGASMVFTGTPSDDNNNYSYWTTATSPWSESSGDYGSPGTNGSDQSLPVEISVWKATSSQGVVKLLWTTDSEIENQGFIIERKGQIASDQAWKEIASFATDNDLLGQGSTSSKNDYAYIDKQVKVGQTYSYRLSDVDYRGNVTQHAAISVTVKDAGKDLKPSDIKLHEAFPNPFNPSVNLSFTLEKEAAALSLEIYDIQGALVNTLSSGYQDMGTHDFSWDGHDGQGNAVPSGVYLVRLGAGPVVQIQRVTLLR